MRKIAQVFILQPLIPVYRRRVFESLSHNQDPCFTLLADNYLSGAIRTLGDAELACIRHRQVKTCSIQIGRLTFLWQPEAWEMIWREKPDCVIVHGSVYDLTSWLILLWGRFSGRPVLSWTIGLQRPETGVKFLVRRVFYTLARGLLLYGDYPKKLLLQQGMDSAHMHVIYNSLDVESQRDSEKAVTQADVSDLRYRLGIGKNARALMFIGRLVRRKRLDILLEATARLIEREADIHLVMIGDGDDLARLRELTDSLSICGKVHFVGALYEEIEIARHMRLCHAAVIPEAGLPIIHPMGYGLPPIISDNIEKHGTEWEAVEDGKTGFFYRDNDVEDLVNTVQRCFADEGARLSIGRACRARVEQRYTGEGHANRILEGLHKFTKDI